MELKALKLTQRANGAPADLYVTVMTVEELLRVAEVDVYHAGEHPDGYQRKPIEYRFKDIAKYVTSQEGLLPTSILANVRRGGTWVAESDSNLASGELTIPEDEKLWVVDGQHRVFGLRQALNALREKDPLATIDYQLSVVIALGQTVKEEMRLFHIVNSRAKGVPTDLAAELLLRAVRSEGKQFVRDGKGNEGDFRKAVGARAAQHLNQSPGPWQGKIRLPNEPTDRKTKPLQVNAVASSLDPALKDPFVKSIFEPETEQQWPRLCGLVYTYWKALSELMPEAFADIEHHSIQRTAGAYAFNFLFPDVLYRCRDAGDFSTEGFKAILRPLDHWVESETWNMEHGDLITRSTGLSSIRALADNMREQLPPIAMPGFQALPVPAPD